MKYWALLLIVLASVIGSCASDSETATEPQPTDETAAESNPATTTSTSEAEVDPLQSFEDLVAWVTAASTGLGEMQMPSSIEGYEYAALFTGDVAYDVVTTNSLVTPYEGTIWLDMQWYANGEEVDVNRIEAKYGYQQGTWALLSAIRCISTAKLDEMTDPIKDIVPEAAAWGECIDDEGPGYEGYWEGVIIDLGTP